ncbi:MAG: 50S ribosomal protein L22 [Candidatus Shikimatogenerans bostrichidophilus]|nr:MAG: 50S ribosomal protein L22 [Candidatus Shikimatogenerans bostrichidophilus]
MGKRKRITSYKIKNIKKNINYSLLRNIKISYRKIRSVTNLIKGTNVNYALNILDNYISIKSTNILKNLILSAVSNYINKNGFIEKNKLYINNIIVNSSGMRKRFKYAPQGRCHIIRKRLSYIKLYIKKK